MTGEVALLSRLGGISHDGRICLVPIFVAMIRQMTHTQPVTSVAYVLQRIINRLEREKQKLAIQLLQTNLIIR